MDLTRPGQAIALDDHTFRLDQLCFGTLAGRKE